ncbi:MAG TPA: MFS transporter [Solirubrobacteraceae bacterium]|nr:MFS transporter [Solirubrobacteraceae bacterium]
MTAADAAVGGDARPGQSVGVVFAGLMLVMLMAALDQTIVATALPTIVGDLGGLNQLSWVVTAYLLAQTVVTPLYGKLGDMVGRKAVLQVGLVIFLIGSALCGLAQNMTELILFRGLQGLGGGGLMVSTMAAIGDVVSPRDRGRYQGYFGAVFGVASVLGPLLGGALTSGVSWRAIFYVNLPIGVIAFGVLQATLPSRKSDEHQHIDYLGAGLLAGALAALVLGCTWGGTTYPWGSGQIIGLFAAAIGLLIGFVFVEQRVREAVLPPALFRIRTFSVSSAIGLIVGFALFGSITYLSLYLQDVLGSSPTGAGLQTLPLMLGLLLTSIGSGQIISRTGHYRAFPIVGTFIMVIGLVLLSRLGVHTSQAVASAYMFVLGLGLGCVMQVLVLAVQNAVDYAQLGVATSGATLFRSIGGTVGTAVLGTIFNNRLDANLRAAFAGHSNAALRGASSSSGLSKSQLQQLPPALHLDYLHAFTNSLSTVFEVAAAIAAVAFLLSWLLPETPLRETATASNSVGEAFATPREVQSRAEAARALSVLIGRDKRRQLIANLAARAGVDLSPAACWLIVHLQENQALDIAATARAFEIPETVAAGALDELWTRAYVTSNDDGAPAVTEAGNDAADRLVAERRASLERLCEGWPADHPDLARLLTRLAREIQPDPAVGVGAAT